MSELEQMIDESRYGDAPLGARLLQLKNKIDKAYPEFASAMGAFVDRLENARAGINVPQVGEQMPNFMLPNENGHLVSLETLLMDSPVVITFHRGHWCPYCRLSVESLARTAPKLKTAQLIAISGEKPQYSRILKAEANADFPMLTDIELGYTLSLNLAIWIDNATAEYIMGSGYDIATYQGSPSWILPIPAVFAVSQDGVIRARHVDPDYRRRIDMEDILDMARELG